MAVSSQLSLPLNFPPSLNAACFTEGECNRDALSWIRRWPNWPNHGLVIHGGEGCGKSHLGLLWAKHSEAFFLNASTLSTQMLSEAFFQQTVFLWDHDQPNIDEEALFHLINHVKNVHGSLLILSRLSPVLWPIQLADLRSRLHILPTVEIKSPEDTLREAVFTKLFQDQQLHVSTDVIRYLVLHGERSFKDIQHLVKRINAQALQAKRAVTIPFVRQILLNARGEEAHTLGEDHLSPTSSLPTV